MFSGERVYYTVRVLTSVVLGLIAGCLLGVALLWLRVQYTSSHGRAWVTLSVLTALGLGMYTLVQSKMLQSPKKVVGPALLAVMLQISLLMGITFATSMPSWAVVATLLVTITTVSLYVYHRSLMHMRHKDVIGALMNGLALIGLVSGRVAIVVWHAPTATPYLLALVGVCLPLLLSRPYRQAARLMDERGWFVPI